MLSVTLKGVAVFNLYELSEDIAFNVDEWSKIISDASAVIYQFPFYWMSAPSLLKKMAGRSIHLPCPRLRLSLGQTVNDSNDHRLRIRRLS